MHRFGSNEAHLRAAHSLESLLGGDNYMGQIQSPLPHLGDELMV